MRLIHTRAVASQQLTSTAIAATRRPLGLVRGIRVLASGREPLRFSAERVWRFDPLPVPDPGTAASASTVAAVPAMELFVRRLGGP